MEGHSRPLAGDRLVVCFPHVLIAPVHELQVGTDSPRERSAASYWTAMLPMTQKMGVPNPRAVTASTSLQRQRPLTLYPYASFGK